MKEERDPSIAEKPPEESAFRKYVRLGISAFFALLLLAVIVGAIMRKFGT